MTGSSFRSSSVAAPARCCHACRESGYALQRCLRILVLLVVNLPAIVVADEVDRLLTGERAPPGVVFEIVSGDADLLRELFPEIRKDIERLRARFPELPVAVVTHGAEQFALTSENRKREPQLHALANELVAAQEVSLHVCGTYAQWFGVDPEEFPEYVNVAATGPTQINDYRALGYVVIVLP